MAPLIEMPHMPADLMHSLLRRFDFTRRDTGNGGQSDPSSGLTFARSNSAAGTTLGIFFGVAVLIFAFLWFTLCVEGRKRTTGEQRRRSMEDDSESRNDLDVAVILDALPEPVLYIDCEAAARKPWEREYGTKEDGAHTCAICLDDFDAESMVREMANCGHIFHQNCCDSWIVKSTRRQNRANRRRPVSRQQDVVASCPVCRGNLDGSTTPQEPEKPSAAYLRDS